jgi:succinate dehydrogenase/fumarate reductase flavoprotein subunit
MIENMVMQMDNPEFDLVVVGSGAAGLTAAVVAAHRGLSVLLVEKAAHFGGTSAMSGGAAWIPNNPQMGASGLSDSREQAETYLQGVIGDYFDAEKVGAFLRAGPEMVGFLEANTAVHFENWQSIDQQPWHNGAARGRTIGISTFDGRRLGATQALIAPDLPAHTIFGGMQVSYADLGHFVAALHNARDFLYTGLKIGRYAYDRVRHGRSTRLVGGRSLIASLLYSALAKKVTLWRSAPMLRLSMEGGRVIGIVIERGGQEQAVTARRGVVLASGGYGRNQAMRKQYLPRADPAWSLQPDTNVGDGIDAGKRAGGKIVRDNAANATWAAISVMHGADGGRLSYPHDLRDRAFPGFMMIDPDGRRFVNEGTSSQLLGNAMIERGLDSAWLICDHIALRRYGVGHVKPMPMPYKSYVANGYLKSATSIVGLAELLGMDGPTLSATTERFNMFAREGLDADFCKGEDGFSAEQGDPQHQPSPSLGPIEQGPFYAVQLYLGDFATSNGLETDASARVLDISNQPIPGLYAVGNDENSVFRGTYPGGGASIGPAMTFGYVAALDASAVKSRKIC